MAEYQQPVPQGISGQPGFHALAVPDVYTALQSHPQGLTQEEAALRLQRCGPNVLREGARQPLALKLLANFTHMMALLLWAGGAIGFLAGMPQLGIAIWSVNIINGAFSFWQEYQAEQATAALRKLLPNYARVVRGGEEQRIAAEALVPGDVLLLAEGDHISADGRLVEAHELRVDQSTLTGESYPVRKTSDAVLATGLARAELPNIVFAGTSVVTGAGRAVVQATGMGTAFGTIAHLTQSVGDEPSPLQRELIHVTRTISLLASGLGALFFVLAVVVGGVDLANSFIFAMGMIVAFVPEGLLPTVTLALAMGIRRMARHHALVKRLSAVETLGSTTVICTDKTGTLTQNEMTVSDIWLAGATLSVTGAGYAPQGQISCDGAPVSAMPGGDLHRLLVAASLCNDARLLQPADGGERWRVLGDPTEAALLVVAHKAGVDPETASAQAPRVHELPFESRRKRMSTIHRARAAGGRRAAVAYVKGAPVEVLARCVRIRRNGQDAPLDEEQRRVALAANDRYAQRGLRVLAVAERELAEPDAAPDADVVERELTLLGLVAMQDPPRPEVAAAVEQCHRAGIRIIMITGDYGLTAESIARRIGVLSGPRPRIINGAELEAMDDSALGAALAGEVLFARVAPEQKLRVVRALQAQGQVVAVTGDGVNDAPALKQADIGVAMGVMGTDVAKEAADMVLTDDNFASIVSAVEEGRAVYANIRKFAQYVFTSNVPEAVPFVLLLFSRGAVPLPLTVMQVLAIDLGTDMVPAMGLGAEPPEAGVMERPPHPRGERLLSRRLLARALLWYGALEAVAATAAYFALNWWHGWPGVPLAAEGTPTYRLATTITLAAVVASQAGAVFCCRTERRSIFRVGLRTNPLVLLGVAVELALLAALVYMPPLHAVFNTAPLGPREWAFVLAWAPAIVLLDEARKGWLRWRERRGVGARSGGSDRQLARPSGGD